VSGSIQAKRDAKGKVSKTKEESKSETKVVDLKGDNVSEAKSTEGGRKAN